MLTPKINFQTIDEYIRTFPPDTQELLGKVKKTIQQAAPFAVEAISYQIPTFKLYGKNLVHFAGYKNHIGFYPGASGIAAFKDEFKLYKYAKGSVQFPLDREIPYTLIRDIVKFRIVEAFEKLNNKKK